VNGQAPLGLDLQPPGSLSLPAPVWGVDPSTKRISVACVHRGLEWTETLSLPRVKDPLRRWGWFYHELTEWLPKLWVRSAPSHVFVEEPFAPTDRRQQPTSYYLMGVLWAALAASVPAGVQFREVGPGTWKKNAMGEGHGAAKPPEYMAWAREVAGYAGVIEDEAAAIGVATAGGVIVSGG
jgi:Holliday junction resolvasome RuvABC endonuclease subunit